MSTPLALIFVSLRVKRGWARATMNNARISQRRAARNPPERAWVTLRIPRTSWTEEFLYELQATDLLTRDQKESLSEFLKRCDLVKFAKYEPREPELRDLHGSAVRLVEETEPVAMPSDGNAPNAANQSVASFK